jgi:hypothetical protein
MDKLDFWVRVLQVGAAFVAAGVAIWVGHSWRRTLRNKSVDECLASIYDVIDLVDRCFSIPVKHEGDRWRAYDEAWNSWRKANGMWAVVRRYSSHLPQHHLNGLADILLSARPLLENGLENDNAKVTEMRNQARAFRADAEQMLPTPQCFPSKHPARR